MKFIDKIKQKKQEKLDNEKIYPINNLYELVVGQFTLTSKPNDKITDIVNYNFKGEELVIAEELKGEELVKYLQKTYNTLTGYGLPRYHNNEFSSVRYFRILTRDNLILPSPTVDQAYRMREATFEGIRNQSITKLITTDFGKKYANSNFSLNDIRRVEDALNGRIEEKSYDYEVKSLTTEEDFDFETKTFTSSQSSVIVTDYELDSEME